MEQGLRATRVDDRARAVIEAQRAADEECTAELARLDAEYERARAKRESATKVAQSIADGTGVTLELSLMNWFLAAFTTLVIEWRDRDRPASASKPIRAIVLELRDRVREQVHPDGMNWGIVLPGVLAQALYPDQIAAAHSGIQRGGYRDATHPVSVATAAVVSRLDAPGELGWNAVLIDLDRAVQDVIAASDPAHESRTAEQNAARARKLLDCATNRSTARALKDFDGELEDERRKIETKRDKHRLGVMERLFPGGFRIRAGGAEPGKTIVDARRTHTGRILGRDDIERAVDAEEKRER